jgi:hypothetical protein
MLLNEAFSYSKYEHRCSTNRTGYVREVDGKSAFIWLGSALFAWIIIAVVYVLLK